MTRSAAAQYDGPWLSGPSVPPMHRDFDRSRHPLIAKQQDAMAKTEAQRREDSAAQGHRIPADPPPQPVLKPRSASRQDDWLTAQRDAALAQVAVATQSETAPAPSLQPIPTR